MISFNSLVALVISCSANRVEIPRRRGTRVIQIIDADHKLERLDGTERSFCLDPHPAGLVWILLALRAELPA
jgi:hypothetical protein